MQGQLSGNDPGMTTEGAPPPLGRYYQVEGRRLLLHRSGSGSPGGGDPARRRHGRVTAKGWPRRK